jgi:hypothetical protein
VVGGGVVVKSKMKDICVMIEIETKKEKKKESALGLER